MFTSLTRQSERYSDSSVAETSLYMTLTLMCVSGCFRAAWDTPPSAANQPLAIIIFTIPSCCRRHGLMTGRCICSSHWQLIIPSTKVLAVLFLDCSLRVPRRTSLSGQDSEGASRCDLHISTAAENGVRDSRATRPPMSAINYCCRVRKYSSPHELGVMSQYAFALRPASAGL